MDQSAVSTTNANARSSDAREVLDAKWQGLSTFTVDEFAEIFRLSRAASYAAVANGEVKSIRIGRRVIIPRNVIEQMLAA
jgi:excisionase family DNA binding protein